MTQAKPPRPAPEGAPGFATRAIHEADIPAGAIAEQPVSPPIWLTSDYLYDGLDHYADVINERRPGYVYGRYGNPTHTALHRVLASLEGAEAAWSFSSGMAATHTTLASLVRSGDHVVAQRALYGGTFWLLDEVMPRFGVQATFADAERDAVAAAMTPATRAVVIEPLANPTFAVADVRGIAEVCAERDVVLVVDNTVATPYLLRPLELPGRVLVVHSTTKYIGGHSDLVGGAVAGPRSLIEPIRALAIGLGTTASAFDAWLMLRGVQTMPMRVERQCATALQVARRLAAHPKVSNVGYSGLPEHPHHARARDLFAAKGFGAMLAFAVAGYAEAARACELLRVVRVGSSFGGLHSEVCHPATTSHRQLAPGDREAAGIGEGLLRLSIGGEDAEDIVADLLQALEKA